MRPESVGTHLVFVPFFGFDEIRLALKSSGKDFRSEQFLQGDAKRWGQHLHQRWRLEKECGPLKATWSNDHPPPLKGAAR